MQQEGDDSQTPLDSAETAVAPESADVVSDEVEASSVPGKADNEIGQEKSADQVGNDGQVEASEQSKKANAKASTTALRAAKPTYVDSYGVTWTYEVNGTTAQVKSAEGYTDTLVIPNQIVADDSTYSVVVPTSFEFTDYAVSELVFSSGIEVSATLTLNGATKRVVIQDNVTFYSTFQNNKTLQEVVVGSGVINLANPGLFQNCTGLVSASTSTLQKSMFRGCKSLVNLELNVSPTEIPDYVFQNVPAITSYSLSGVTSIGQYAFNGTNLAGPLEVPDTVTSIGKSAFSGTSITSVTVGSNVSSLNTTTFSGCKITDAVVNTSAIGPQAFQKNPLTSLSIGANVQSISQNAFKNVTTLNAEDIQIDPANQHCVVADGCLYCDGQQVYPFLATPEPDPVSLDTNASRYITADGTLHVPASVESIDASQFSFKSVEVAEGNTSFVAVDGVLYTADMKTLVKAPRGQTSIQVPEGVEVIGRFAFINTDFNSILLPSTLRSIEMYGFKNLKQLTSIALPEGFLAIGNWAFSGCTSLQTVEMPDSLTDLGVGVFESTKMTSFTATPSLWGENAQKSKIGDFDADGNSGMSNMLWYNTSARELAKASDLYATVSVIDLSRYTPTFVPHYAFAGLPGLTEVALPANVMDIGYGSFYLCKNLNDVYVYNPTLINIWESSSGQGSSGSGDATETYTVSNASSFATWDNSADGEWKYVERSGIRFYGAAYEANTLIKYCDKYNQTFIPIVTLQTLSASENPFSSLQRAYELEYGDAQYAYCHMTIRDIDVGGTPQVVASFGRYDGTRDLTNDAACSIVYFDPDGSLVTSFDKEGEYTAYLTGDGKSVFGARQIKFYVGERPQEQAEPADETETPDDAKTDEETKAPESTSAARPAATRAGGVVYQTVYTSGAAVQSVTQGATNAYAVDDKTGIASALDRIAGTDSSILVWGGGTEAAPQYVWEVPGTGITADNASGLDFGVSDASKDSKLASLTGGADFTAFTVAQDGTFPGTYALHWKTSSTFYDGAKVNVYRVVNADGANPTLELVKSGVSVVDGYVTVDVDGGGTYMLMEAIEDAANPLAEKAYADTGVDAVVENPTEQSPVHLVAPLALIAVIAAAIGTFGGWFLPFRRRDEGGTDATTGQKL